MPAYTPDLSALPISLDAYLQFGEYPTEGHLFTFDLDYDGTEEEIRFTADYENGTVTIFDGDRSVEIPYVGRLLSFMLIDLDPATPYANIIVCYEISWQNNMTVVLHPEGDQLADWGFSGTVYWENGALIRDEYSMLLGKRSGWCVCSGEELTPDSDWRTDDYIPTTDELEDELDYLIESGTVLHAVCDLPCRIDGAEAVLDADTCMYVLRFSDTLNQVEVETTEGVVAILTFTGDAWTSLDIDGVPQEECFDNMPKTEQDPTGLPLVFNAYQEVGVNVSEAEMFRYDIDGDGEEEIISFRLDENQNKTIILVDEQEIPFDCSVLSQVILIDLDPQTPWINMLVEVDWGSDDYITTEMHFENGKPVKGTATEAVSVNRDGRIVVYYRTDFLGTKSCWCTCSGEALTPDSDWLDCHYPTEQEIAEELDELAEFCEVQYTKREVPCTINGRNAKLAKGIYIYPVRYNLREKLAEVRTLDGKTAIIAYTDASENDDDDVWGYLIDGISQDEYFDYILYAD